MEAKDLPKERRAKDVASGVKSPRGTTGFWEHFPFAIFFKTFFLTRSHVEQNVTSFGLWWLG